MQVKEYIQALTDEYTLRVEKIGSGNWYWSFKSEVGKRKEEQLGKLREEERKLGEGIREMEEKIEAETKMRDDGEEVGGLSRKVLLEMQEQLLKEKGELDAGLAKYCSDDPEVVARKVEETRRLKASVMVLTDNLDTLGDFVLKEHGGDRSQMANYMVQAFAGSDEYVAGEGLKDLEN